MGRVGVVGGEDSMSAPLHAKIPTVGVRIHEFEHTVPGKSAYSDSSSVSVDLWDVSGDYKKYKERWPAIQKDADGVLFVFDADTDLGPKSDVEIWFSEFLDPLMRSNSLTERQVAACGHSKQAQDKSLHPDRQLPANLPRMKPFRTSLNYEDGKQQATASFNALMTGVIQELKDKQDRLESQIST